MLHKFGFDLQDLRVSQNENLLTESGIKMHMKKGENDLCLGGDKKVFDQM